MPANVMPEIPFNYFNSRGPAMRSLMLLFLGIPIPIIILIALFT